MLRTVPSCSVEEDPPLIRLEFTVPKKTIFISCQPVYSKLHRYTTVLKVHSSGISNPFYISTVFSLIKKITSHLPLLRGFLNLTANYLSLKNVSPGNEGPLLL